MARKTRPDLQNPSARGGTRGSVDRDSLPGGNEPGARFLASRIQLVDPVSSEHREA